MSSAIANIEIDNHFQTTVVNKNQKRVVILFVVFLLIAINAIVYFAKASSTSVEKVSYPTSNPATEDAYRDLWTYKNCEGNGHRKFRYSCFQVIGSCAAGTGVTLNAPGWDGLYAPVAAGIYCYPTTGYSGTPAASKTTAFTLMKDYQEHYSGGLTATQDFRAGYVYSAAVKRRDFKSVRGALPLVCPNGKTNIETGEPTSTPASTTTDSPLDCKYNKRGWANGAACPSGQSSLISQNSCWAISSVSYNDRLTPYSGVSYPSGMFSFDMVDAFNRTLRLFNDRDVVWARFYVRGSSPQLANWFVGSNADFSSVSVYSSFRFLQENQFGYNSQCTLISRTQCVSASHVWLDATKVAYTVHFIANNGSLVQTTSLNA